MSYDDTLYSDLTEDELLQMLANYQGSTLPGKTPSQQLNYYQDLVSTLGFDPVQQSGIGWDEPAPQEEVSLQRTAYSSNPIFSEVFDRIDSGSDPISAYNETRKAHEKDLDWEGEDAKTLSSAAKDYAFERAKSLQKAQSEGATYTRPDGSKYKNAPLGGNNIFASASEYDLLGQPTVDDLVAEYGRSLATPRTPMQAGKKAIEAVGAGWDKVGGVLRGKAPAKPAPPPTGLTGDKRTDDAMKMRLTEVIDKKKATQVRSDANVNAMRRILALRTVLGA